MRRWKPSSIISELPIPGVARGIEIRRHDAPNFINEFQTELVYTLFDCKDSAEVISKGFDNALLLVTKTIDKVMTSEIPLKD
jgi:DNA polymerase elongation subunit (family B)